MASHEKRKLHQMPENHVENGLNHSQLTSENIFLSGIKQRLLSFIFRGLWNEETDQNLVGYLTFQFYSTFWFVDYYFYLSNADVKLYADFFRSFYCYFDSIKFLSIPKA